MENLEGVNIGIYEKALPKEISWEKRIKLAKECGYDFIELSIDETEERLMRLDWSDNEIKNIKNILFNEKIRIPSMCFSVQRKFPMGSIDENIREKSMELLKKAILFADKMGIRIIQIPGYDVYYEESSKQTEQYFMENLKKASEWASKMNIILAFEVMDTQFMNSIEKYIKISRIIKSSWIKVYPDVGNLSAWTQNNVIKELELGILEKEIIALHLKDTLAVTKNFPGKFRDVPFGKGCVKFKEIFSKLKQLNYKGPFLIEMWTENSKKPIEEIKNARKWILEQMKEGGYLDAI